MNFKIFFTILTSSLLLAGSILILLKGKKTKTTFSYSLFVGCVGLWTVGVLLFYLSQHHWQSLMTAKLLYFFGGSTAPTFYYFSVVFGREKKKIFLWHKLFILIPTIIFLPLYFLTDKIIADVFIKNGEKGFIYGYLHLFFDFHIWLFFSLALWKFLQKYRKMQGTIKFQLLYVNLGTYLSLSIAGVTNIILPSHFKYFTLLWAGPTATLILISFAAYAIFRYRLMDIHLAFRRSFLKIILAAFTYGAFYGVSWLFIETFGSVWAKPSLISGIFIAILFAVMWTQVEKLTLKFSNKYVYASIYTIQDTISNLTRQLTTIVNLNKIAASISNAMIQVMDIEKVAILVKEINKNNFKIQQIIGFNEKKILNINQKSVSNWLNEHKSALVQGEIALQAEDNPKAKEYGHLCRIAGAMKKLNIELCLPLIVRDNLIGFILLGEKKSANAYTAEDIKLLETLSNQASVAIENALLYDNMEEIIAGQTADLRNKNQRLEKLLKMRSEFLDIASHQLRTPVSVIKGNLSMFLEGDFDKNPSAQKTALQSMFEKTEKLNSIINDILIASEVDTDNLNLSPLAQTEDVGQIAAKSIKFLQDRITAKKINFTFAPPREKLPVKSYERYLSIVIDNLIDNAITYTPNGGSVNIVLTKEKETNGQEIIKFAVTDSGIGVPQADQKKLFDKFRRAGNANNMKTDGTGIGLFIVKKLVKAHQGGQIGFVSQENKGSTFWFSLPMYR